MIHAVDPEPIRLLQVLRIHDLQVASENRLDAGSERMRIKAQAAKNIHQVADADGNASALFHCMDHGIHANDAVCNRIFGMEPEMDEARIGHVGA